MDLLGTGSFIDPGTGQPRLIPLELFLQGDASPRYGQIAAGPGQQSKLKLQHQRGALAMARSEDPNSASAQFYIALRALPELDGRYAVFGRVTSGMEVVDRIKSLPTGSGGPFPTDVPRTPVIIQSATLLK